MALKPSASIPVRTCISSCMGLCARLSETRRVRACVRDFDHSSHGCPPPPNETPRENKMTERGLSASLPPSRCRCLRPVIPPTLSSPSLSPSRCPCVWHSCCDPAVGTVEGHSERKSPSSELQVPPPGQTSHWHRPCRWHMRSCSLGF